MWSCGVDVVSVAGQHGSVGSLSGLEDSAAMSQWWVIGVQWDGLRVGGVGSLIAAAIAGLFTLLAWRPLSLRYQRWRHPETSSAEDRQGDQRLRDRPSIEVAQGGQNSVEGSSAGHDLFAVAGDLNFYQSVVPPGPVAAEDVVFPVRVGVPSVVGGFTGRDGLLVELSKVLAEGPSVVVTQSLVGWGGRARPSWPPRGCVTTSTILMWWRGCGPRRTPQQGSQSWGTGWV